MLYRLARRYDDLSGEADVGSQLRAAFKGWLRHGVALDREWNQRAAAHKVDAPRRRRRPRRTRLPGLLPAATARRLLPRQRLPARRHAVRHQRAPRDRRLGGDPRWLVEAEVRRIGQGAIRRDRPCRGARAEGRSRVRARRVQRDRVPRPELVGRGLGRPRVRDPDLRGLAPQRLRRVGRAARRPQHALRPSPVVIGPDGDRRGGPPRRAEPPPAAQLRGEHDQRRAPVRARQDDQHAPPGRRHLHEHGGQARRLAVGRRGDALATSSSMPTAG